MSNKLINKYKIQGKNKIKINNKITNNGKKKSYINLCMILINLEPLQINF